MKILILSTSYPYKTAGIAALDLYSGLKNTKDIQVKLLIKSWHKFPDTNISSVENLFDYFIQKLEKKIKKVLFILKLLPEIACPYPDIFISIGTKPLAAEAGTFTII